MSKELKMNEMKKKSRKELNLPPAVASLHIALLIIQHHCEVPLLSLHCPQGKSPHLHALEFSSNMIFDNITGPSSETGINLRNLPPAHSQGAVTFSLGFG